MASNYYDPSSSQHYASSSYDDRSYNDRQYARNDAPLPSIPPSFDDDRAYPYRHSNAPSQGGDSDPFEDDHAIPMGYNRKHDSTATVSPMLLQRETSNPPPNKISRHAPARNGWFTGQVTYVVYVLTLIQIAVFIAQLARNGILTGTPIEIHPSFNPMIGPSPYLLINMGARYQPCMHSMPNVQNASLPISWPCPNATATTGASVSCPLSDLCGFNGVPNPVPNGSLTQGPAPNQWWRFIVPIFLHAGIVHIAFNLLLQLTLGRDVERLIGSARFALVYFASGIFGFVLGGNFAATGIASCGCSGSLFGILAITLLDLLYTWPTRKGPVKDLLFILVDVLIAFVLGLLPGLDNFSHIGGFLMGLVLGLCILRSPLTIAARRTPSAVEHRPRNSTYSTQSLRAQGLRGFLRSPLAFFEARRGIWWLFLLLRGLALLGVLIGFILLLKNFYVWRTGCGWCKYLSCLPIKVGGGNWCTVGNLDFRPDNGTTTS